MGVEVPAHGGLLDIVRQDFSRLIWAEKKTEQEKGALQHEDIQEQNDNF